MEVNRSQQSHSTALCIFALQLLQSHLGGLLSSMRFHLAAAVMRENIFIEISHTVLKTTF